MFRTVSKFEEMNFSTDIGIPKQCVRISAKFEASSTFKFTYDILLPSFYQDQYIEDRNIVLSLSQKYADVAVPTSSKRNKLTSQHRETLGNATEEECAGRRDTYYDIATFFSHPPVKLGLPSSSSSFQLSLRMTQSQNGAP